MGGKGGRCVGLTTLPPSVPIILKYGDFTFWNPLGLSRPVQGLFYLQFYLFRFEQRGARWRSG